MLHDTFLLTLVLLIALVASTSLAARLRIPYVILLVLAGALLGVIPRLPHIELDPEIILLVFLPPLIFSAAWDTSWRNFRRELIPILFLAVGLVLVTTICVATVAHMCIPGFSWPAAFVLGAVVSPTDTVAAEAIMKHLGLQQRIASILQGESLVNDATALVTYSFAVAAVSTGTFALPAACLSFVLVSAGGILVGLLVALPALWLYRRIGDPSSQIIITILTCFASYLLGEALGVSGVLATVANGLFLSRRSAVFFSPETRLKASSFWNILVFLLNGFIFLLIGLELSSTVLPELVSSFAWPGLLVLLGYAALISLTVIVVRLLWSFVAFFFVLGVSRMRGWRVQRLQARPFLVIGWGGMRGGVSMATALAVPLVTSAGTPFPDRALIIFLTFGVILATLLLQGLTLGPLIRRLGLNTREKAGDELQLAYLRITQAALTRLDTLQQEDWAPPAALDRLRAYYEKRENILLKSEEEEEAWQHARETLANAARLASELHTVQRQVAIELRNQETIDDDVFHTIEHHLDLEEQRFQTSTE